MKSNPARGLAIICDLRGMIVNVIRNDARLPYAQPGQLFVRLISNENRQLGLSLMTEIKLQGVVLEWELNVKGETGMEAMKFAGNLMGDTLLIIATPGAGNTREIYEELLRINNEQANLLRAAIKQSHVMTPPAIGEREYEEITRLNNELVSIQRESIRTNAELVRLSEVKNQFVDMAVHDLRNPLKAVTNYTEAMLDMPDTTTRQRTLLNAMLEQFRFIGGMVDDLLDIAVVESGKSHLQLQPVNLGELLAKNLEHQRTLAAARNIEIRLVLLSSPVLMLDRAKMEQVLDNLFGNAIEYSPPNAIINTVLAVSGSEVRLSVRDEGLVIPIEELAPIVSSEQTASNTNDKINKNNGLGLTIVKSIIASHGGRMWLESEPDFGTVFQFTLPAHPAG